MCAQKDKEFFDILKQAELATPDSIGIIIGAKLQNKKFKERIPGQAYFREVIRKSEIEGWSIYILGGTDEVIEAAVANVKKDFQMLLKARDDVLEFLPTLMDNKERYPDLYQMLQELERQD